MILAVTGHRQFDGRYEVPGFIQANLHSVIVRAVGWGYTEFRCGMALGVDMLFAEMVPPESLHAFLPYKGYHLNWGKTNQERFNRILSNAGQVTYVTAPPFASWKMILRDKVMVRDTTLVIAVWDGRESGGTYVTIKYAEKLGIPVFNAYDNHWLTDNKYDNLPTRRMLDV